MDEEFLKFEENLNLHSLSVTQYYGFGRDRDTGSVRHKTRDTNRNWTRIFLDNSSHLSVTFKTGKPVVLT